MNLKHITSLLLPILPISLYATVGIPEEDYPDVFPQVFLIIIVFTALCIFTFYRTIKKKAEAVNKNLLLSFSIASLITNFYFAFLFLTTVQQPEEAIIFIVLTNSLFFLLIKQPKYKLFCYSAVVLLFALPFFLKQIKNSFNPESKPIKQQESPIKKEPCKPKEIKPAEETEIKDEADTKKEATINKNINNYYVFFPKLAPFTLEESRWIKRKLDSSNISINYKNCKNDGSLSKLNDTALANHNLLSGLYENFVSQQLPPADQFNLRIGVNTKEEAELINKHYPVSEVFEDKDGYGPIAFGWVVDIDSTFTAINQRNNIIKHCQSLGISVDSNAFNMRIQNYIVFWGIYMDKQEAFDFKQTLDKKGIPSSIGQMEFIEIDL